MDSTSGDLPHLLRSHPSHHQSSLHAREPQQAKFSSHSKVERSDETIREEAEDKEEEKEEEEEELQPFDSLQEEQLLLLKNDHDQKLRLTQQRMDTLQLENDILKTRVHNQERVITELNRQLVSLTTTAQAGKSTSSRPPSAIPVKSSPASGSRRPKTSSPNVITHAINTSDSTDQSSSAQTQTATTVANPGEHLHCKLLTNLFTDLATEVLNQLQEWWAPPTAIPESLQPDVNRLRQALDDTRQRPITQSYLLPNLCSASLTCVRALLRHGRTSQQQLQQQLQSSQEQCEMQKQVLDRTSDERRRIVRIQTNITRQVRQLRRATTTTTTTSSNTAGDNVTMPTHDSLDAVDTIATQPPPPPSTPKAVISNDLPATPTLPTQHHQLLSRVHGCLEQQIAAVAAESEKLHQLHGEYRQQRQRMQQQLREQSARLQQKEETSVLLQQQTESLQKQLDNSRSEVQTRTSQLQQIRCQLQTSQAECSECQRMLSATRIELGELRAQHFESQRNVQTLQQSLEQTEQRCVRCDRLIEQLGSECKSIQTQLQNTQRRLVECDTRADCMQVELRDTRQQLRMAETERETLQKLSIQRLQCIQETDRMIQKLTTGVETVDRGETTNRLCHEPIRADQDPAEEPGLKCVATRLSQLVEKHEQRMQQIRQRAEAEASAVKRRCAELEQTAEKHGQELKRLRSGRQRLQSQLPLLNTLADHLHQRMRRLIAQPEVRKSGQTSSPRRVTDGKTTGLTPVPLVTSGSADVDAVTSGGDGGSDGGGDGGGRRVDVVQDDSNTVERLHHQLQQCVHSLQALTERWQTWHKQTAEHVHQMNDLDRQLRHLQQQRDSWQRNTDQSSVQLIEQMKHLQREVDDLRLARGDLQQSLTIERERLRQLEQKNRRLAIELKQSSAALHLTTQRWQHCASRTEVDEQTLTNRQFDLDDCRQELVKVKERLVRLQNQNHQLNSEINCRLVQRHECERRGCECVCHCRPWSAIASVK